MFAASPGLREGRDTVLRLGVGHGLIYLPHPEWVGAVRAWARASKKE